MLFFGKKAVIEAEATAKKAENIKRQNERKFHRAEDSSARLHQLLKANGISLRIHIATGGDRRA